MGYLEREAPEGRERPTGSPVTGNVREVAGDLGSGLQGGAGAGTSPKRREDAANGCLS